MSNREHLMCLAAFSALVALSGVARADFYSMPDPSGFARSEDRAPMTCAQAQAFAWFKHQLELPDVAESSVSLPAECERTDLAKADPRGDREVNDEEK